MGLFKKFEEAKQKLEMLQAARQSLNQVGRLIKSDKEISDSLQTFLAEAEGQVKAAANNPAADSKLREAFNNVAGLFPVANHFARAGELSIGDVTTLVANTLKYKKSIDVLTEAANAGNPVVLALVESMQTNKSLIKLAAKTHGTVFSVRDGVNGEGLVSVSLPIAGILPETFTLCEKDYNDFKVMMKEANNNKPQPPKGPGL